MRSTCGQVPLCYPALVCICDMVLWILQLEGELIVELLKDYPEAKAWLCFNCKVSGFSGCIHVCMYMCLTLYTIKLLYNSHYFPVLHSLAVCCYLRMTANFHFFHNNILMVVLMFAECSVLTFHHSLFTLE